ncbi:hypothetical protein AB5I41_18860 [Sphingomonas sp. MMS24-JH45]
MPGASAPVAPATPAAAIDGGAKPVPGDLKTFRDWTVACDNIC